MKTSGWIGTVVAVSAVMMVLYGCPKKAEVASAPEESQQQAADAAARAKAEEQAKAEAARKAEEEKAAKETAAKQEAGLKPIYFDYDKSFVRDDAMPTMRANAEWLKANPKVKVRIEGNCDDRGTIEYNQALGQRRATATKKYLADLGITAKRISLISYGKEKPVCQASTEDCWQKNRRADLVPVAE